MRPVRQVRVINTIVEFSFVNKVKLLSLQTITSEQLLDHRQPVTVGTSLTVIVFFTKRLELSGGPLSPLSEFSAVLGPLVTIGGPVPVGGGLRRDKVFGVLLSQGLAVLGISLADGGTPSGPCISGGARGRESRKGRESDTTGRLGSRDCGCLRKSIVVSLPLVAVLRPGWGYLLRGAISRSDMKELIAEIGEALTRSGLPGDERKVRGVGRGLVLFSQL